jgi:hypothetical protein
VFLVHGEMVCCKVHREKDGATDQIKSDLDGQKWFTWASKKASRRELHSIELLTAVGQSSGHGWR